MPECSHIPGSGGTRLWKQTVRLCSNVQEDERRLQLAAGGRAQANCCSDTVVRLELHPAWAHVSLRKDWEKVPPRRTPVSSGGYKLWSVEQLEHRVCDLLCCVHICPEQDHKQIITACFRLHPAAAVVCHFRCWSGAPASGRRWCTAGLCDLSIMSASVITYQNIQKHAAESLGHPAVDTKCGLSLF